MLIRFFIFLILIGTPASAKEYSKSTYDLPDYPFLSSTVIGSLYHPAGAKNFYNFEYRKMGKKKIKLRYYPSSKGSRELIFVLAGTGGKRRSSHANLIASEIARKGKHALIIPSTFTKEFALSLSSTGYVGHIGLDARDLYLNLKGILEELKRQRQVEFKKFSLIGYSLGALCAAHIGRLSLKNRSLLKFERIVMINPPVDFFYGLDYLDRSVDFGPRVSLNRKSSLVTRLVRVLFAIERNKSNFATRSRLFHKLNKVLSVFSEKEFRYLIAKTLMGSLNGVVKASQKVHKLKLTEKKRRRGKSSFLGYTAEYFLRYHREVLGNKKLSLKSMNKEAGLEGLSHYLKRASNVFMIHNKDDFLLKGREDIQKLRRIFVPDRIILYPHGGHVGGLWWNTNREDFLHILFKGFVRP